MFEEFVGKRVKLIFKDGETVLVYIGKIKQVNPTHLRFFSEKINDEILLAVDDVTKVEPLGGN